MARKAKKKSGDRKFQADFEQAVAGQQRGHLDAAIAAYNRLLKRNPGHLGSLTNLATALKQAGRKEEALKTFWCAVAVDGAPGILWFNYANLLREMGQPEAAEQAFRSALDLDPKLFQAATNLGRLLSSMKRYDEAIAMHRRAVDLQPHNLVSLRALGRLCIETGRLDDAEKYYRAVLAREPGHLDSMNGLGVALKDQGRHEEAIQLWQQVIERVPRFGAAHNNLGALYRILHRYDEAIGHLRTALEIDPADNVAAANLAHVHLNQGRTTDAETLAREIIKRQPDDAGGHLMLGFTLAYQARVDEAVVEFLESHRLEPAASMGISNALFASLYSDTRSAEEITTLHRDLAMKITPAQTPRQSWPNDRGPDRRLKIGYLSADLRGHPVGMFVEPILSNHDQNNFEIHCFSTSSAPDAVTDRLRQKTKAWHDCNGWPDDRLTSEIETAQIDILVDLAGHTALNRCRVLRTKPAPVQVLYIGYPGTSGLPEMDYLIADGRVCPPGTDHFYTERVLRLPGSFWCFQPPESAPEPGPAPLHRNGFVTFGSCNALQKLSPTTVGLWARVLNAVPGSRLRLKSLSFADQRLAKDIRRRFADAGLDPASIDTFGPSDRSVFYKEYHQIDIALDPVPYNGGTTTCEALWMGVPVIALEGELLRGRMSAALLRITGVPELVAGDADQYVANAAALANDVSRLDALHRDLRPRMAASPLCDGARAAGELEDAFRTMWRQWVEENPGGVR